jgi:spore germination protein YaaH
MPQPHNRFAPFVFLLLAPFSSCSAQQGATRAQRAEYWGFTGPWEAASDSSVKLHANALDVVVTGWIGLDSATARPLLPSPYPDTLLEKSGTPRRFAMVTSWHGDRFHPRTIRVLAAKPQLLTTTARAIADHAASMKYSGLVLDFEALEPADLQSQIAVIRAIAEAARSRGVSQIALAIPAADSAYPVKPLLAVVDYVIVMLYDQHWTTSEPGPISDPAWVKGALAQRVAEGGADRVVAAFPTYTYRWRRGQPTEILGYREAVALARRESVPLERDAASGTMRAKRGTWDMWVTDAALIQRLVRDSKATGVHRFAFWRLGQEDPALWTGLSRK